MKRFRLSKQAFDDLNQIRDFLRDKSGARFAQSVLEEIADGLRFVARNPAAGHRRVDLTDLPVRFWLVDPYLIVYSAEHRPIEIVRVLHGSRDAVALLDES